MPVVGGVDALLITVAASRPDVAWISALCALLGSLAGSAILFGIARKGGEVFLRKYTSHGSGKKLHAWFERYGLITVFVPAMSPLPLPMKIPVFCSGALGVGWGAFLAVVTLARGIRYFALAWLAQRYGAETMTYLRHHLAAVFGIALSLAIAAVLAIRVIKREEAVSN